MALPADRIHSEGQTAYTWEREAIAFIKKALPAGDPYHLWPLQDLSEPSGRIHQLDAIVIGYHAIYVVEVKSWPGTLEGDFQHWRVRFPDGRTTYYDNPIHATNTKAKVLASLLEKRLPPEKRPWVEPLVLLSDPTLKIEVPDIYLGGVVTPAAFARAVTFGEVPHAADRLKSRRPVNKPTVDAVVAALGRPGALVPSRAELRLGDFQLQKVIEDGPGYQDWLALHDRTKAMARRIRLYLLPPSASAERKRQLRRAAEREAKLLTALDHPSILRVHDYRDPGPTDGPALAFEHLEDAQTLESLVRLEHARLPFSERVTIVERLAEALHYCHGKSVFHRGLHPGSVLVRRRADGKLDVRLYNFQLAQDDDTRGTVHLAAFTPDTALLYRAPEVFQNPDDGGTEVAEVFSVGAVAYFVLTGQHPGASLADRLELLKAGGLSVAAASDAFPAGEAGPAVEDRTRIRSLDAVVRLATDPTPEARADDLMEWLSMFLEAATRPEPQAEPDPDPLEAVPGTELGDGFQVVKVLGSGSTAKVLLVRQGDSQYALKIALDASLEDRLVAEGEALRKVQADRIVRFERQLVLGGRACLLLGHAGETLAHVIARDGPAGLDFARRWGEDLLLALGTLEERGVLHKDVKPANLGVLASEAKKARHLFLFDFSLTAADPSRVDAGTPAYRDPFIQARGRWDEACDRWAAALTLHELLTGVLPRFSGGSAATPGAQMAIGAERFDPAVRAPLADFFRKALARDVSARHATAEEMRTHWLACFGPAAQAGAAERAAVTDEALAALAPESSIEATPLSAAARNALDRSGVVTLRELLEIPRNEVSAIRGAGRATVKEILALAERYQKLRTLEPGATAPFFPAYRGRDGRVSEAAALASEAADALDDAGLGRLFAVAGARKERVERVLAAHAGAAGALGAFLAAESDAASTTPCTIEGFVELLLPTRRKSEAVKHVRLFYGLDTLPGVVPDDARSLATALDLTSVTAYVSQNRLRTKWREREAAIATLQAHAIAAVQSLGGVAPLARAAESLPAWLPHESGQEAGEVARRRAEALLRIVAQVTPEGQTPPLYVERVTDRPWIAASRTAFAAARVLGETADELAAREPLLAADGVQRELVTRVQATDVARLPPERLVALAAEASRTTAVSARLELYPRGLSAARALELAAGALGSGVTPEDVRRAVATRYPEAEALPDRPALDPLLSSLKLQWDEGIGKYLRLDLRSTASHTEALPSGRTATHFAAIANPITAEQIAAAEFEDRMKRARAARSFRLLDVNRAFAEDAAERLASRLGARTISLDQAITDRAWARIAEQGADLAPFVEADRQGEGPIWKILRDDVLAPAALDVLRELRAGGTTPVVLVHPGILARYRLGEFFDELDRMARAEEGPAIFLVNPSPDASTLQPIHALNGALDVSVPASQHVRIPREWIGPTGGRV